MTVGSEYQILGLIQAAATGADKDVDERAGGTVVAIYCIVCVVAYVQMAIRPEGDALRPTQTSAARGHKGAHRSTGRTVELENTTGIVIGHIKVAVRTKGDTGGPGKIGRTDELIDERTGYGVVPQDLRRRPGACVEIAIRADNHIECVVCSLTGTELLQERTIGIEPH